MYQVLQSALLAKHMRGFPPPLLQHWRTRGSQEEIHEVLFLVFVFYTSAAAPPLPPGACPLAPLCAGTAPPRRSGQHAGGRCCCASGAAARPARPPRTPPAAPGHPSTGAQSAAGGGRLLGARSKTGAKHRKRVPPTETHKRGIGPAQKTHRKGGSQKGTEKWPP
jgi:hypothetical protein